MRIEIKNIGLNLSGNAWKLLLKLLKHMDGKGFLYGRPEGYPESTFYRLMNELANVGVVMKDETGYRVDLKQAKRL